MNEPKRCNRLIWLGDSLRELKALQAAVQDEMAMRSTWRSAGRDTCRRWSAAVSPGFLSTVTRPARNMGRGAIAHQLRGLSVGALSLSSRLIDSSTRSM